MKALVIFLACIAIALSASAADRPDKQLAFEYLEAAQYEKIISASIEGYNRQLSPQLPVEQRSQLQKMMNETLGWTATKNQLAELVTDVYTTEELKSFIAFSKTREGRSYNEKGADFSDKFSVLMARNMQKFVERNFAPPAKPAETQRVTK